MTPDPMPSPPDDTTSGPLGSAPSLEAALRHRTWVRALAASLVGESSLADDVAQETWTRVIASPPPGNATWRSWLAGVVRNVVRDTRRSNARRARREAEAARSEVDESSSELLERVEEEGVLVKLVVDLEEPYRSAILRRYFDGWSVARIAQECGAPEPTVRTRLRRGLGQLREALDKRYGGDRRAWMSAVTALFAPASTDAVTGALVIGGLAMGTKIKVSAAVLFGAVGLYFVTRSPEVGSPQMAAVEPSAADVQLVDVAGPPAEAPGVVPERRSAVEAEPRVDVDAATGPVFWPETTLTVRDARTRAHLQDVEIRCALSGIMGLWRRPGNDQHYAPIADGLQSPIALRGAHAADDPETLAGLALSTAGGEAPRFVELTREGPEQRVYARAPGYAWGSISVDLSSGGEYELLLGPDALLTVHLANVQLEHYAAIGANAELGVHQLFPNGNEGYVWFQDIDETLAAEGLRLDGVKPGDYSVFVRLRDRWSSRVQPLLAREEVSIAVGEPRELMLRLDDPPEQERRSATLAGVVSFPHIEGDPRWVRLDLLEARNAPVRMLSLADMERTDDTRPTWSFRVEDLPEGRYQFLLRPFMVSWMVELPAGGRDDLELVIPEFAEVLVETVDARTGERVPLDSITFGLRDLLPDQIQTYQQTGVGFVGEPGLFRFATTPGAAFVQTSVLSSGHDYGWRRMDLELVPGRQSVRLELGPRYAIRLELRENGKAAPSGDDIYWGSIPSVRAVDHGGRVTHEGFTGNRTMEVSSPGVYEVGFDGVTAHRFHPIPPRLVDVRAGEVADVVVELQRR